MACYKKTLKNGKTSWYTSFTYTDWKGEKQRKKKSGFERRKDAEEYEQKFLEKIKATPEMSFATLVDLYVEDSADHNRISTMNTKLKIIKRYILPDLGKMSLPSITPLVIREWHSSLLKKGLAPSYLATIHSTLSAIFNFGIKFYSLTDNPTHKTGTIGSRSHKIGQIWTPEQFRQFAVAVSQNGYKGRKRGRIIYIVLFHILYWTGCRIGEALALTPADFVQNNGQYTLSIIKDYNRIHRQDITDLPKTPSSIRKVALPEFLVDIIKDWIRLAMLGRQDRLFDGISRTSSERMLTKCAKKAGLPAIRVHDLRHSHASLLIELGCSPLLIAERLGHKNPTVTLNIYSHLFHNKQNELALNLQNCRL